MSEAEVGQISAFLKELRLEDCDDEAHPATSDQIDVNLLLDQLGSRSPGSCSPA